MSGIFEFLYPDTGVFVYLVLASVASGPAVLHIYLLDKPVHEIIHNKPFPFFTYKSNFSIKPLC